MWTSRDAALDTDQTAWDMDGACGAGLTGPSSPYLESSRLPKALSQALFLLPPILVSFPAF